MSTVIEAALENIANANDDEIMRSISDLMARIMILDSDELLVEWHAFVVVAIKHSNSQLYRQTVLVFKTRATLLLGTLPFVFGGGRRAALKQIIDSVR